MPSEPKRTPSAREPSLWQLLLIPLGVAIFWAGMWIAGGVR